MASPLKASPLGFSGEAFDEAIVARYRDAESAPSEKPRASGLAGDAREIAYSMWGTPYTEEPDPGSLITTETGGLTETISLPALEDLYGDMVPQLCIGHAKCNLGTVAADNFVLGAKAVPYTGHPDGHFLQYPWLGVEHKHLGRFGYKKAYTEGLAAGAPDHLYQMVLYGHALGWTHCLYIVLSQDASSMRFEARQGKKGSRLMDIPGWDPKRKVEVVHLEPWYDALLENILERAEWFVDWAKRGEPPETVKLEKDPNGNFPWGYSKWRRLAIEHGDKHAIYTAPKLILERK